jgi:hypothetical protein
MASATHNTNLYQIVQGLYSRVVLTILDRRIKAYRRLPGADNRHQAAVPLAEEIKSLAVPVSDAARRVGHNTDGSHADGHRSVLEKFKHHAGSSPHQVAINNTVNDLSVHLKHRQSGLALRPEMGERLRSSTREHLHAAHRLAREDQARSAALHADIASHALIEASHYMSDDDYAAFISEINGEIQAIKHPPHA